MHFHLIKYGVSRNYMYGRRAARECYPLDKGSYRKLPRHIQECGLLHTDKTLEKLCIVHLNIKLMFVIQNAANIFI